MARKEEIFLPPWPKKDYQNREEKKRKNAENKRSQQEQVDDHSPTTTTTNPNTRMIHITTGVLTLK